MGVRISYIIAKHAVIIDLTEVFIEFINLATLITMMDNSSNNTNGKKRKSDELSSVDYSTSLTTAAYECENNKNNAHTK